MSSKSALKKPPAGKRSLGKLSPAAKSAKLAKAKKKTPAAPAKKPAAKPASKVAKPAAKIAKTAAKVAPNLAKPAPRPSVKPAIPARAHVIAHEHKPVPHAAQAHPHLHAPQPIVTVKKPLPPISAPPMRPLLGKPPAPAPKPPPRPATQKPRQITRSFYWSELRSGDDLPPLTKAAIDRIQIARYAGAANDFNRLQLDEPYAHALGFRGAFAPGALAMGFVGQLLTNWLKRGHVRRLSARFVKIIWPGDELTCHGRISELRKEKGACYADLELWAENQKGELVLRGQASCELYETPGAAPTAVGGPFSSERPGSAGTSSSRPASRRK